MFAIQSHGTSPILSKVQTPIFDDSGQQVLIKVAYTGLCRTDVLAAKGILKVPENRILGHECSGIVEKVSAHSRFSPGMRVTVNPLLKDGFIGITQDGCFAQWLLLPEYAVYELPSNLSLHLAAFTEPVAAALAIFKADIHPTQSGLLLGSGRITDLSQYLLKEKGFQNIHCQSTPPDDQQFDFIIETNIHQQCPNALLKALKPKGLLVLKTRMHHQLSLATQTLIEKEIRIQAVHYGDFEEAIDWLANKNIPTNHFGDCYSLTDFIEQFDHCEEQKIFCCPNGENFETPPKGS